MNENNPAEFDGRVQTRKGRWRYFWVYGRRCRFCSQGILWIKRLRPRRQIAIEPGSWNGEEWYTSNIHRPHMVKCLGMREAAKSYRRPKPAVTIL